jgi:hypothetical protein
MLKNVNPQHDAQPYRRAPVARLGIVRLDQRLQLRPRHDPLHLFQNPTSASDDRHGSDYLHGSDL